MSNQIYSNETQLYKQVTPFVRDNQQLSSATPQFTTSTSFINSLNPTFNCVGGLYNINIRCEGLNSNVARRIFLQYFIDGALVALPNFGNIDILMQNFNSQRILTPGNHTFLIQFRTSNADGTSILLAREISITRIGE